METVGCIDEQTVVSFLGGQMAEPERLRVEAHLDTCSACAELMTWAAAEIANRSLEPGEEGRLLIGELAPGSLVDRYQILGAVGRGGMGEVYAAYHPDLDRRIALKVVGEAETDSTERRARLLREARAIARLSHPNVITVHDAGTFGNRVYIAMEFVEGETADVWLRARRHSWRQIVDVFIAAGRGLAAAHAAGVIHRDFKPANVMVGRDGSVRVMDFGLARLAEEPGDVAADSGDANARRSPPASTMVTQSGALIGTLAYMAPEQFRREPTDARADQFSFCVALHEAIYGRRPALRHLDVPSDAPRPDGSDPPRADSDPKNATAVPTADSDPKNATAVPTAGSDPKNATTPPRAGSDPKNATAVPRADSDPKNATAAPRADSDPKNATTARTASSPAWLRSVVARGLSEKRDQRFSSMNALLAALDHGQTRVRRRMAVAGVALAVALLTAGAWRVGAARRVACAVPQDQLAAVWPAGDESNPRRQAVHRAFTASGLPTAEATWRRVAAALDDYVAQWSAMYVSACEATHVRGDQPPQVLDLRMACLDETLDGVRALTEVLARADAAMVGQAATAALDLAPVKHCADIPGLHSAVPVPRDEATASAVADVRRALRDAYALFEVGNERAALAKARELLPRAESTRYKPLVAELLYLMGNMQSDGSPADAEITLEQALATAEAGHDDLTAAKAAIGLIYATSYTREKRHECDQWASLASGILDRLPPPQRRLRAWFLNNKAGVLMQDGNFAAARPLLEQALALKEEELGNNNPDVVRSAIGLIWVMNELGRPEEALRIADRCLEIVGGYDTDSVLLSYTLNNRGDALNALKRFEEAEADYRTALRIMRAQFGATSYRTAIPIVGIAQARLGAGDPEGATHRLQQALSLQEGVDPDAVLIADTRFALARALAASGKDRKRARALAASAAETYATHAQPAKQRAAAGWLAENGRAGRP